MGGEGLDHGRVAAVAVLFLAAGGGVERLCGGVEGVEQALIDGAQQGEALVPGRGVGADVVLGDHGGHRVGEAGGGAEEGGDVGVACLRAGVEAAVAGDETVEVRGAGGGEAPDLDRHAQAGGGDGVGKLGQRLGVEGGAVAGEGFGVDGGEGEVDHGGLLRAEHGMGAGGVAVAGMGRTPRFMQKARYE